MSGPKPGIEVYHFQRKPRASGNFSLEFIFQDVRNRLADRVQFTVIIANHISNGFFKRFKNMWQAWRQQGPINHVTGDIHYITLFMAKRKTILTILDCGFMNEKNPLKRWILKWFWLKIPVWKSAYITAISSTTKADIIKYSGCSENKVVVIPVAISEKFVPAPRVFNTSCPVLLQIGASPNKNIERLIRAIEGLHCQLVIIGKLSDYQINLIAHHQINFVNKFNISQEEIIQEYENCDIVVFASTLEGFGMPILEANTVERPVLAGNNSSMPEVGGNAAFFVDANSEQSIRQGIERLIQDDKFRNQLLVNGRENRKRFQADHIANMYFELYQRIKHNLN
jgi:glycosyltransferase involved in cell wall biosynthesis